MPVHVGTSGWQDDSWRGRVHPPDLPERLWRARHSGLFGTVEVDSAPAA